MILSGNYWLIIYTNGFAILFFELVSDITPGDKIQCFISKSQRDR